LEHRLVCINCGAEYPPDKVIYKCENCSDLLSVEYDYEAVQRNVDMKLWSSREMGVWRYWEILPINDPSKIVSLHEGGTNLHKCKRLAKKLGLENLYVKNEGENPTGSFKDRGMTVGVSRAVELGFKTVACASTGNTSASLAAYAAKSGLHCIVLIPSGKIAFGKLAQAIVYGAHAIQIRGNFDDALQAILELTRKHQTIYLLNSINPYRIEGQKTLGFEVCDQLGYKTPDTVIVPVGNAGNISAIWKGFTEFKEIGVVDGSPRMIGIQAEGAAPIATAFKRGWREIRPVDKPETIATAIRIGEPASWKKALKSIRESKGLAETVSDEEIVNAQKLLARLEGLFVEPASASSIAGLIKLVDSGLIDRDEVVVCVATGHGLKDPEIIMKTCEKPVEIDAGLESLEKALGAHL
jgi:threonine synthase